MSPPNPLLIFASATALLALSPGPNQAYLLSRTIAQGRRAGIVALLGIETGFLIHLAAVVFGLAGLLLLVPLAYSTLRMIGAGYLLYLAWRTVRRAGVWTRKHESLSPVAARELYWRGMASNVLNPKTAMFYVSIFPQFVDPHRGPILAQSTVLGLLHITVSTICNLAVILVATQLAGWLRARPLAERWQRWLFGGLLAGFALKLAVEERR